MCVDLGGMRIGWLVYLNSPTPPPPPLWVFPLVFAIEQTQEMARAEAGMSVLAQAAGLLDIQDSVVEEDGSGSVRSYSDNSSSGESFARPHGARLPGYRYHGGVPDHGSTPPGSASPPPGGGSSGGMTAAGAGGGAPYFGGGGGGGGNAQAFASAFALGTGETVRTGEQGYRDGSGSGSGSGGQGGTGGAVAGSGGGPPLQRPGWLVGPGGVQQRRSLQSVPGPWRPYWKDSGSGGGGGNEGCVGAAAAAALRQHGGDEMKR